MRVAVGRDELERLVADVQAAGGRQHLEVAEAQRPGALDVVVGVEVAQPACRVAHLGLEAGGGRLADPERGVGEREAPEDVVEVAVGGQQSAQPPAHLRQQRRQGLELLGVQRRVHDEGLIAVMNDRARRLPLDRLDDDHLRVDRQDLHQTPSSLAASNSDLTSAVGFLAPGSSGSLRRLTQMTGTLSFTQGSTSW